MRIIVLGVIVLGVIVRVVVIRGVIVQGYSCRRIVDIKAVITSTSEKTHITVNNDLVKCNGKNYKTLY